MPSFDDARALILGRVAPIGTEDVPLLDALGRVVATDIVAQREMHAFDNSAMDGFEVRAADCAAGEFLPIVGYLPAGASETCELHAGTAIRIMTGAPVPSGCDTVIPFEDAEEREGLVSPTREVRNGQHVRHAGEDVSICEIVVPSRTVLRPVEICAIAGLGVAEVSVYRRPRVAILSTGDELVNLGESLTPGKIVNSNSVALAAAVREVGCEPVILGIAADTVEDHRAKLQQGLAADVLITSAGVSTGDRDLVRGVLAEFGVEEVFYRVDVKPGGPTAFAMKDAHPIFCLPGNPVAALLMFETFVRPALLKMLGHERVLKRSVQAILQEGARKTANKTKLQRVRVVERDGRVLAYSSGDQNTGMLGTLVKADGIAVLSAIRTWYAPGEQVEVQLFSDRLDMVPAQA